jgi:hypothetical protein
MQAAYPPDQRGRIRRNCLFLFGIKSAANAGRPMICQALSLPGDGVSSG